jgi:Bacterial HORMA domain 2
MTGTAVRVNTTTYTTTYVAGNVLRSMKQLIAGCGLDPRHLADGYGTLELGIKTWLDSGHLQTVTLEVFRRPGGGLVGRFDFDVDYGYGRDADGGFWLDPDEVAYEIRKCGLNAAGCDYRVVVDTASGSPDVAGWGPTTYRSTDGFIRHAVGTGIGAGAIGVGLAYYSKAS